MDSPLSTVPRFLYLNTYAFLLLCLGTGIGFIPVYRLSGWWLAPQVILCLICLKVGLGILKGWPDKKRKYNVLMERNREELRPETFTEFMQAPCGRLLVKVVLHDLGREAEYPRLKALVPPLSELCKEGCKRQKTNVTFYNES